MGLGVIRVRRTAIFAAVLAAAWAIALATRAPVASASSCPQANELLNTGFTGTGGLSYVSGVVSSNPDQDADDTESISLDHHASGMKIVLPKPESGSGGTQALGQPTGGTVSINDTYNDTGDAGDPGGNPDLQLPASSSTQTYSGPNVPNSNDQVTLNVDPSSCTYEVSLGFDVPATETPNGATAPGNTQKGEGDQATSGPEPIPADLNLTASATIPATFGGNCTAYCYDLSGDPDWGGSLDLIAKSPPSEPGTATITWQLSPATRPSHGCVVPTLRGLTQSGAASMLKSADCKLGRVKHKRSSSVRKGRVISSSPKAGTKLPAGTKVGIVLSSG